ncbi:type I restriction endonuclease subunit R [Aequorivita sp. H23M31]|uniref:Type I restriction enzyme endonuclease subunit n=1 Tax=Aequorivita ciconiae TaxID=2494375 RepID=A0A410G0Q4_9FLAO|nr:type I restriction endonuclease subunit R [Aequorivita sp. H23M31]QAA80810.1 type I restriction endonuclease subunit R [Aequorivita sp. H23M31]
MAVSNYTESQDSQTPALNLLQKLGWDYITPEKAVQERDGLFTSVLLEDILTKQLSKINSFEYKGEDYKFSTGSIQAAINALKSVPDEGLSRTNEKVYDLLTLGKSFTETIQGDSKGFTLRYIDWENIENNSFHVTEEFEVEGINGKRRPDLVLFVNGIPFVVIENKRRDKNESIDEAISQMLRNQRKEGGIPRLFYFAQLLVAVHPNEVKYGTTGTPAKFWSVWKEENEKQVQKLLKTAKGSALSEDRLPTTQDKSLVSLCSPQRVMELAYKYIVFDGPIKKIGRYQQYFAVQDTMARVKQKDGDGNRYGGVIWHTTGSGKSLTMVMLSKALALDPEIPNPRVVIVTDRISLDKQIYKTFQNCGKRVEKAQSGSHLTELLKDKGNEIITTIIDKFQVASNRVKIKDSQNIFVLVDESHRSNYGTAHASMKKILPNASYIGFTGTPLMKTEKSTARKFGSFIHKYTIDQAVKDGAVLPLLYEGRSAKLKINKEQIDKGFERLAKPLAEEAQKDLKKKFSSISKIYESDSVVEEIAYDISKHYTANWQGTRAKAQLAVPKIDVAIKYQKYFETQTDPALKINTRVVFTPPDSRKDNEDVWQESSSDSRNYWEGLMKQFRDQDTYENYVVDKFIDPEDTEVEMLIVVSKLLTGFDAPVNTLLYLAKPLKGHNLLQAIARVNRLFKGKEYGYIIDYVGVLGKLDEALTEYSALEDFEEDDLLNAVADMSEEVRKVPIHHAEVWDIFKSVKNKDDIEALERCIAQKDVRDEFYERLSQFARTLQVAMASDTFYEEFTTSQIGFYKNELKKLQNLRVSVMYRYAEAVSYKEYEPRVKKLLDTYVNAYEVMEIIKDVNIFDKDMVEEALETYGKTPASKADFIAHRMKKVITENMEKDEAYYKKFSDLIEQTINDFHEGRMSEKEYLESINKVRNDFDKGYQEGIPDLVKDRPEARAVFGAIAQVINEKHGEKITAGIQDKLAIAGIDITKIIEKLTIRDWKKNLDVQNKMENEIEDYLMEHRKDLGVSINFDEIDIILAKCLKVAKNNY